MTAEYKAHPKNRAHFFKELQARADPPSSLRILGPEPFRAEVGGARGGRGGEAWRSGCSGPGEMQMTPSLPNALKGKSPAQEAGEGSIRTWP